MDSYIYWDPTEECSSEILNLLGGSYNKLKAYTSLSFLMPYFKTRIVHITYISSSNMKIDINFYS